MTYSLLGLHANATVGSMAETIAAWKPPLIVLLDHSDVWHQVKAASPKTTFVGRIYIAYQPDFNNPNLDPIQTARDVCAQILPWAERMGSTYSYWQGVNEPVINCDYPGWGHFPGLYRGAGAARATCRRRQAGLKYWRGWI